MSFDPKVIEALALLRTFTGPGGGQILQGQVVQAVNTLDDAGVFAALDEQTDYALAEEILAEAVPNTADPAEWGDTTSADMARHQGLVDDPADIAAAVRRASCTCGRPDEPSPALHAGTCPVWAQHHNLI